MNTPITWHTCSKSILGFLLALTLINPLKLTSQDWPNLAEYQTANAGVPASHPDQERVVFMGNSITIGWLQLVPEFFEQKPYLNRGIGGQTTPQMLLRFRQDVIDLKPRVVLILAGTNDIAGNTGPMTLDQTLDNIKSMADLARGHGIEPILCSVLPASDYPWSPGLEPNKKIPRLNIMIREYAMGENLIYLDYFSAMANSENGLDKSLAEDGVHPTKKGYQIMGTLAEKAIAKAIKRVR